MSATTQEDLFILDAGRNRQKIDTVNTNGVHTIVVTTTPSTAGGGSASTPSVALTTSSETGTYSVPAGAVAVMFETVSGTPTVDGQLFPNGILSIAAPEGFLLPAIGLDAEGAEVVVRELRPA